jgi:RND superfamily putative drug exporter
MAKKHITQAAQVVESPTKQRGFQIFEAIGRFSVTFRWLVILVWVVGTVLAVQHFPSLSSVTQSDNTSFLPANAPSQKAINLAKVFGKSASAPTVGVVVATKNGSSLSTADSSYITSLQTTINAVSGVQGVRPGGVSADGQAEEFDVIVSSSVNTDPTGIVTNIRNKVDNTTPPSGLQVHLTGQLADEVDNSKKSGSTNSQIQLGAVLFIIVLLLVIFRAPLAPLVTLIPPLFVVTLAGPVIGEAANHGLKVSSLAQLLLTVLVIGAGTDYGLFLIFRVREEIRRGLAPKQAIIRAMGRVGETITFSAATVIAALLSLLFATFQLYSNLGAPLAIGIGLMLLAGLTLLPALLALFGRAVFWPSKRTNEETKSGFWGRVSSSVVQRPIPVLIVGVVIFGGLALFVTQYKSAGFGGTTAAPTGTDSAQGDALITKHFPSNSQNPTGILFVLPHSVWQDPAPLVTIQSELAASSEFTHVTGPLDPNGVTITPKELTTLYKTFGAPVGITAATSGSHVITGPQVAMSPALLREYEAYQILSNLVSKNGRTVEFAVGLTAGDPGSTSALNATPAIRARVQQIASTVGATNNGVAGESTALYDISSISNSDLKRVVPIAIVVIGVLLAILLRSLVAPLYLIASVALSYLASLGVSVIIFMKIEHNAGLTFILPFLMFIFLLALGEDYNILVMTRIREEAHGLSLKKAVSQALTTTGTTVTSAGLVLAGTFAVFATVGGNGNSEVRDIGFGLALGILMDTFLVRTLLVPAIVVLLGRWNWWPTQHGSWIEEED